MILSYDFTTFFTVKYLILLIFNNNNFLAGRHAHSSAAAPPGLVWRERKGGAARPDGIDAGCQSRSPGHGQSAAGKSRRRQYTGLVFYLSRSLEQYSLNLSKLMFCSVSFFMFFYLYSNFVSLPPQTRTVMFFLVFFLCFFDCILFLFPPDEDDNNDLIFWIHFTLWNIYIFGFCNYIFPPPRRERLMFCYFSLFMCF